MLYVDQQHHSIVHPLVVSWGQGYGFSSEFGWTGMMLELDFHHGMLGFLSCRYDGLLLVPLDAHRYKAHAHTFSVLFFVFPHIALDFWEFYGADNIREYLYKTAQEAGE